MQAGLAEELQAARRVLRKPQLEYRTLRTGISAVVEYLIEVKLKEKVPSDWLSKSTTKSLARYHTPRVEQLLQVCVCVWTTVPSTLAVTMARCDPLLALVECCSGSGVSA